MDIRIDTLRQITTISYTRDENTGEVIETTSKDEITVDAHAVFEGSGHKFGFVTHRSKDTILAGLADGAYKAITKSNPKVDAKSIADTVIAESAKVDLSDVGL